MEGTRQYPLVGSQISFLCLYSEVDEHGPNYDGGVYPGFTQNQVASTIAYMIKSFLVGRCNARKVNRAHKEWGTPKRS